MNYRNAIRYCVQKYYEYGKLCKKECKIHLGFWNDECDEFYRGCRQIEYQRRSLNYKTYRRKYEAGYRAENRAEWNLKSIKSIYKKKYPQNWEERLSNYKKKKLAA